MTLAARLADLLDGPPDGPERTASTRLHAIFDVLWEHHLETTPENATYFGEPGPTHRWSDESLEGVDRRKADTEAALAALRRLQEEIGGTQPGTTQPGNTQLDGTQLDDIDATSLRLAMYEHELAVDGDRFPDELLPLTTMTGLHIDVPTVMSLMPARTLGDLDAVAARVAGVPVLVDQIISRLEEGRRAGITLPQVVAAQIPAGVEMLAGDASPLLASFDAVAGALPASDVADIEAEARDSLGSASSALRRLASYLRDTYVPACRETTAFCDLPDGAEWYAAKIRRETTTDLSPEDIHATGKAEVARIRKAMDEVIDTTGFATGANDKEQRFAAFSEFLRSDPRFVFPTAEALLAHYRDIAKRADAEMPRLFGFLPRLPYGVKAIPEHEAPTAPLAYYLPGSLEVGRPGMFCANTYDLPSRPRYDMEATCLHEAVPGHHLQLAIAAELEGLPKFRAKTWWYNAYAEGWGLYAESLGEEMGFYTDPYDRFGQLASELWRAIRLVVDTGLHALGWSREQAIDYCRVNSTAPMHDIVTEIDRYLSIPGQALSYKIGELTITRLRREAAAAATGRGANFDLRGFHDVVLGAGALPLAVLEERVRAWQDDKGSGEVG